MMKVALIGYGYWGKILFKELKSFSEIELTCVIDNQAIPENSDILNCELAPSIELLPKDIDFAVVATPLETHFEIIQELLGKGINVLCEKPLVKNINDANKLFELAKSKNLVLLTGYTYLHNSAVIKLQEMFKEGFFGPLKGMRFSRSGLGPIRNDVSAHWDLSVHDISILVSFLHESDWPLKIQAFSSNTTNTQTFDETYVRIWTNSGIQISISANWAEPNKDRCFSIAGSKKIAFYDEVSHKNVIKVTDFPLNTVGSIKFDEVVENIRIESNRSPLQNEIEYMITLVSQRAKFAMDTVISIDVIRILCAIDKSLLLGKEVVL